MPDVLYRYQNNHDVVLLETFNVIKNTPKGTWINISYSYPPRKRFVLNDAKKRFAYPTQEEAKTSFLARKSRQLGILKAQIESITASVRAINENRIADYARSVYFEI